MKDLDFIDELRSIICPIDSDDPSKVGMYYCYKNGKLHDFDSFEEADFFAKTNHVNLCAYGR